MEADTDAAFRPIDFAFELTQADVVSAQRWWLLRRLIPVIVLVFGASVVMWLTTGVSGPYSILFEAAILAGLMFWLLVVSPRMQFRAMKPGQLRLRGRFGDEAFELSSDAFASKMEWGILAGQTARKDSLLIFARSNLFHILPRRGFASDEEFAAAQRLLSLKLKPRGKRVQRLAAVVLLWFMHIALFAAFHAMFGSAPHRHARSVRRTARPASAQQSP